MNFNWKNSAKWGAFTGFGFLLLTTLGDYMLVGNSICKDFFTFNFYKKLVLTILVFSLGCVFFDRVLSLFLKKKDADKKSL